VDLTPPTPRLMIIRATIRPGSPEPCLSKGGRDVIRRMVRPTAYMLQTSKLVYCAETVRELKLTRNRCEGSCSDQDMNLQWLPSREA
jgi:hypothetical protein